MQEPDSEEEKKEARIQQLLDSSIPPDEEREWPGGRKRCRLAKVDEDGYEMPPGRIRWKHGQPRAVIAFRR